MKRLHSITLGRDNCYGIWKGPLKNVLWRTDFNEKKRSENDTREGNNKMRLASMANLKYQKVDVGVGYNIFHVNTNRTRVGRGRI